MPEPTFTQTIHVAGVNPVAFFGPGDKHLREIEAGHPEVSFHLRDNILTLNGAATPLRRAAAITRELLSVARSNGGLGEHDLREITRMTDAGFPETASQVLGQPILTVRGKHVRPQTQGQRDYVAAVAGHTITFGIGPAGTGKTYLAMALAVQALQRREVNRIILTRPAVEAGERLGFLPGSLEDKIDPYLRPLFDAVGAMLDSDVVPKLFANGTIEVAPLAYMRGRTLNESFVILDEAQNTTPEQMKMFLTRLGFGSKMVITGDITQVDLPLASSGLRLVTKILDGVEDIHFATLTSDDIVRHSLVGRIVDAYTSFDEGLQTTRKLDKQSQSQPDTQSQPSPQPPPDAQSHRE